MKLTRLLLTLAYVVGLCVFAYAQPQSLNSLDLKNIKVDNLSDAEIGAYYEKAQAAGFDENKLYEIVAQKGMPPAEIDKLRDRISLLGTSSGKANANAAANAKPTGLDRQVNLDANNVPSLVFRKDSIIFGSELFSTSNSTFEPNLRIATPSNYVLGPDDELTINIFGYSEQTYNLTVNQEGNIYIPNVGPLNVNGLSIEQASTKIKNKLASTIYRNINSGTTKVQISLGRIRSIRVTVVGEARRAGTYTVSSLTTLFNILYQCGGPSDMGSYRNIELIRGNQVKRKVDLYNFLVNGSMQDNVMLEEGDVIRIPYYNTRVTLKGEVKRQGKFEVQPGETFTKILNFAGGFTDSAYKASVQVAQITDIERKITDITASHYSSYLPLGSDFFTIGKVLNRYTNRVTINGAVLRPGNYELDSSNKSLAVLIQKAGGLREDAYLDRGVISRLNEDLSPSILSFNVKNVVQGSQPLNLKKEDVINIASLTDLKDNYKISIEGEIRIPGQYNWREGITLKDLIFQSGGFTDYADPATIEISRRVKNANVSEKEFQQAQIIRTDISNGKLLGNAEDVVLQPFDIIVVRSLPGYVQQRSVYVSGQVISPGRFIMQTNTEKISDLVNRFGGFKSAADSNFITIRRVAKLGISKGEKEALIQRLLSIDADSLATNRRLQSELNRDYDVISVDIRKALANQESSDNVLLEDGDLITVDRTSSLIKVSGEVYYPTVMPFENGKSMKYYISRSGSFTDNARKKGAMVIYPDGKAKTIGKFFFFNSYPSITPRSEIFVPTKNRSNRGRLSTGEWVAISSIFATLGTLIITAFRNN